jgi:hypothetical protein
METQEFRTFEGESFIPDYAPRSSASLHPIGIGSRSPSRNGATPDPSRHQEGKLPPVVNQEMYSSALSELQGIRFEIAHVEKTLDALKAPVERTTLGRPIIRKNPAPLRKGTQAGLRSNIPARRCSLSMHKQNEKYISHAHTQPTVKPID